MNFEAMNLFLSDSSIKRHLEHLRGERLRYSILEKSVPELKGCSMSEIVRLSINRDIKDEAISLLWYIKAHECFFNSFCYNQSMGDGGMKHSLSKEKNIYEIYTEALSHDYGFLFVYPDRQGNPRIVFAEKSDGAFIKYEPYLAIDLYEHTYFLDYGFDKKQFLKNSLIYLDISSLDNRT